MKVLDDPDIDPTLLEAARTAASSEGITLAKFINAAVAERLSALNPEAYFAVRATRARPGAISALLDRAGNEPPQEGDRLDDGLNRTAAE